MESHEGPNFECSGQPSLIFDDISAELVQEKPVQRCCEIRSQEQLIATEDNKADDANLGS